MVSDIATVGRTEGATGAWKAAAAARRVERIASFIIICEGKPGRGGKRVLELNIGKERKYTCAIGREDYMKKMQKAFYSNRCM